MSEPRQRRRIKDDSARKPRLRERLGEGIRIRSYSPRTEKGYGHWVRRFIRAHRIWHTSVLCARARDWSLGNISDTPPAEHRRLTKNVLY